ncbi:UvrD-helicase domain-containing protein [Nocardia fluminea]|uniref:UvrD-helicase domain-containing protein n=1 Tax=Nocardia fluminea TaxID=134984 RepID=UPI0033CDE0CD
MAAGTTGKSGRTAAPSTRATSSRGSAIRSACRQSGGQLCWYSTHYSSTCGTELVSGGGSMPNIHRERIARWAERTLAEQRQLTPDQRRFLAGLLTVRGWHVLVDRGSPMPDRIAAFALGRTGVFALVFCDALPSSTDVLKIRGDAEQTFARFVVGGAQFVPHSVDIVLLMPRGSRAAAEGRYLVVDETSFVETVTHRAKRMRAERVSELAATAAEKLNTHNYLCADDAPQAEAVDGGGLFDQDDLRADARTAALARPFSDWMTFLDPEQLSLVHTTFTGPARFSGPAGTGKSVVALHRMAHFAKRSPGRLLFTTFVRSLPTYHERGFAQLAPHAVDRAQFKGLHAWATAFLRRRRVEFDLDNAVIKDAFSKAWRGAGRVLDRVEGTDRGYWKDEIDRVIKGRRVTDLVTYKRVKRVGREGISLRSSHRQFVWEHLYLPYQEVLDAQQVHDFNDVISLAVDELRARPLDSTEAYSMVVVDEVQDFTLTQLQLVHQIAGGDSDAQLLLVGDGQQQVYAGGCTLSEAGIPLAGGRGRVLRTNYRNREAVLRYSQRIDAGNTVDDLDGGAGVILRDSDPTLSDGHAEDVHVSRRDIDRLLPRAIREAEIQPDSEVAVVVNWPNEVFRYLRVLRRAGIDAIALENDDGSQVGPVKVGTVRRAKGMDFAAVFHITEEPPSDLAELSGGARDRAEMLARQLLVATSRARDYLWVAYLSD